VQGPSSSSNDDDTLVESLQRPSSYFNNFWAISSVNRPIKNVSIANSSSTSTLKRVLDL